MDVDLNNGEPSTSTSTTTTTSISKTINNGDHVLLRLADGGMRGVKVDKDAIVSAGRLGTFQANELIGQPYGFTHEIVNKKGLKVLPPRSLQEVEDTEATNELINDGEFVQPLTIAEITALKQSGVHADDIIKKQIDAHANYALKTEYSKEKYRKRKEAKYSKTFTTVEPTLFNVCDHWFKKDNVRVRDIRNDTLSQMLNLANVKPGGRYLAVDDASGLVVAGMLSRMGGEGRILTICDTDSPPAYPVMVQMNFPKEVTKTLTSLNWATSDEDYIPVVPPGELPPDDIRSEKQKTRIKKRKIINDALANTREELFAGGFDGLIVATEYDPMSVLEKLVPCLSGSASIVVQSPYAAILHNLQTKLRSTPGYLAPTVTESWLRRYQVLPGRTHPTMTTSGTGGYILHAIKVYDDPEASAIESRRPHRSKKAKLESSTADLNPSSIAVVENTIEDGSTSMAVDS